MRKGLEVRGYPPAYLLAVELRPSGGANIPAATEQLAPAVDQLLAQAGAAARQAGRAAPENIDLVAHSMGALSARYYALIRPDRVRTLLTLAGANHGSDRFCPPSDPPGARELCPAFASGPADGIQMILNGTLASAVDETPYGLGIDPPGRPSIAADSVRRTRYANIDARRDEWIVPDSSTHLAGTGGWSSALVLPEGIREHGAGRYVITGTDHDAIVRNPAAIALVAALLAGGG
jgi:pimeloyl-ACP methyl ester carboxylesterase